MLLKEQEELIVRALTRGAWWD